MRLYVSNWDIMHSKNVLCIILVTLSSFHSQSMSFWIGLFAPAEYLHRLHLRTTLLLRIHRLRISTYLMLFLFLIAQYQCLHNVFRKLVLCYTTYTGYIAYCWFSRKWDTSGKNHISEIFYASDIKISRVFVQPHILLLLLLWENGATLHTQQLEPFTVSSTISLYVMDGVYLKLSTFTNPFPQPVSH